VKNGSGGTELEACAFYGRPTEPLAFYLPPYAEIHQQEQSPLYSVLPKEVRDMVWEFALADDDVPPPDHDNMFRRERSAKVYTVKLDSACPLLQTCKVVYLETYRLPMLVNGTTSPLRVQRGRRRADVSVHGFQNHLH
jgi:hypothetical protein